MLEYVFFHVEPCERFRTFLTEQGLAPQSRQGELEIVLALDEDAVDDDLADAIDACYDEMFEMDQRLYDQRLYDQQLLQGADGYSASGVVVHLKDGRSVYAGVRPDLLGKLAAALTPEEIGELVDAVVTAVEEPDERSLCRREV